MHKYEMKNGRGRVSHSLGMWVIVHAAARIRERGPSARAHTTRIIIIIITSSSSSMITQRAFLARCCTRRAATGRRQGSYLPVVVVFVANVYNKSRDR